MKSSMIPFQVFLLVLQRLVIAQAYVPAQATNSSQAAIEGGLNVTDVSKLHLQWYLNGTTTDNVSYQLAGSQSNGISEGALVHFSEAFVNESTPPTNTAWIAMISCDANATNPSMEVDVFTLARDKGAKAALLYSLYSLACIINPEYADPRNFDHVFDIFSTQSLDSARLIEMEFRQGLTNMSSYGSYDSKRLNDSGTIINSTIEVGYPVASGYMYAVLQAYNATGVPTGSEGNTTVTITSGGSGSPSTALAMIVLYAITGCVSALFCVVIISGAIRAIRHPERYGPRARSGDDGSPPQSRARGLTRAILDTFPVVKFGSMPRNMSDPMARKDIEEPQALENTGTELMERSGQYQHLERPDKTPLAKERKEDESHVREEVQPRLDALGSVGISLTSDPVYDAQTERIQNQSPRIEQDLSSPSNRKRNDITPEAIGTETCPICILDFEEGDNVRILPCEGQHKFHQSCVDPWLLELSGSCPICRHDFHALETMLSNNFEDEGMHDYRYSRRMSQPTLSNRFSRYLRFARRRRSQLRREMEHDSASTDPHIHVSSDIAVHES
ncbi:hypothetical protein AX15_002782 [Amanita polypyramis BW_CC]|nr:hypothetical protein AX15_002782 [Amanita polypyramis BW_CC]